MSLHYLHIMVCYYYVAYLHVVSIVLTQCYKQTGNMHLE